MTYFLFFLCSLEELFLCLNDYETVSCPSVCCHSLKLLHITDNNLQDWTEIRKLGVMFPSLDTLVLANNHLNAIEEPDDSLARLFPNLRSISLHKSGEVWACSHSTCKFICAVHEYSESVFLCHF